MCVIYFAISQNSKKITLSPLSRWVNSRRSCTVHSAHCHKAKRLEAQTDKPPTWLTCLLFYTLQSRGHPLPTPRQSFWWRVAMERWGVRGCNMRTTAYSIYCIGEWRGLTRHCRVLLIRFYLLLQMCFLIWQGIFLYAINILETVI